MKTRSGSKTDAGMPVLVIGGGVSGQRAALDLAHAGLDVLLLEKETSLGGTVAQLGMMFPQHNCLLCRGETRHGPGCTRPVISSDLLDRSRPDNLSVWTRSRVVASQAVAGGYRVTILREPRFVDPGRCISCDRCVQVCPKTLADSFQAGLTVRKAAYRPSERAVPDAYAIDKGSWCEGCGKCQEVCPTQAIDLNESPRTETFSASAIVVASGMQVFDPAAAAEYGYGRYPNVVTGLQMERMTSPAGPGEGRILRPSDGQPPQRIAWLQCIGSRDHSRDYCSSFCCGYATRQAVLARQHLPAATASIFMMDDRVFARGFGAVYDPLRKHYGIELARCRLSVLREDPGTRDLVLQISGDDGKVREERFGMVVLSVGAQAPAGSADLARSLGLKPDGFGFFRTGTLQPADSPREAIFVAGAAAGPADVADSAMQGSAAAARVCRYLGWKVPAPARLRRPGAGHGPAAATRRIGVFACDCAGEIAAVVDLPGALGALAGVPDVAICRRVPFGCLGEGLDVIAKAVKDLDLSDVVIGACNRRTFAPLFQRAARARVSFVSLREECALVHAGDPAGATRKATELLRAAAQRIRTGLPASGVATKEPARAALVIGGGLSGLTAALHLADAGIGVHVVEREARLGGHALRLGRSADGSDVTRSTRQLISRIKAHELITVHASHEVVRLARQNGGFVAALRPSPAPGFPGLEVLPELGAVIVATGAEEYRGPAYGLGRDEASDAGPAVMTLLDFASRLRESPKLAREIEEAAFIGCVGPWDEPGSSSSWRCSRSCCETMIAQARAIKEANPGRHVAVLMREVNTYAFREEQYTAARRAGVLFVRFDPTDRPRLAPDGARVRLRVRDTALGEDLELAPELVVLASAILPRSDASAVTRRLGLPLAADGFLREWEAKTQAAASLEPGIFICGLAAGPKPAREVITQALAAAHQAGIHLSRQREVSLDEVATVDPKLCAACLTCVRVCPYGVPVFDDQGAPAAKARRTSVIDPFRCQGCGTCVAECPAGAIRLGPCDGRRLEAAGASSRRRE